MSHEKPKLDTLREGDPTETYSELEKELRKGSELQLRFAEEMEVGMRRSRDLQNEYRARIEKLKMSTPSPEFGLDRIEARIKRYEQYILEIEKWIEDDKRLRQLFLDGANEMFRVEGKIDEKKTRAEIDVEDGDTITKPDKIN